MKFKDKLLNKVVDMLSSYIIPKYDTILSFDVKGKIKGVLTTYDCTYTKELKDKEQEGFISIEKLLEDEIGDSRYSDIFFCEKDKVICIHDHSKNCYVEPVHECFDSAEEKIYLVCDTDVSYESVKGYVSQSSKYHQFLRITDEIPNKIAYNKLFNKVIELDKEVKNINNEENNNQVEKVNRIEIEGKISHIGKEFKKRDGEIAQFIDLEQEYEYNGKSQKNVISVMLEGDTLSNNRELLQLDSNVNIVGKLNVFIDKNKQNRSIINCDNLEILEQKANKNIER